MNENGDKQEETLSNRLASNLFVSELPPNCELPNFVLKARSSYEDLFRSLSKAKSIAQSTYLNLFDDLLLAAVVY